MNGIATMAETLGERIKRLREAADKSQPELAQEAGVTLSNLRHIEQGVTPNPRLDTIRGLAKALNVTLDELAGE